MLAFRHQLNLTILLTVGLTVLGLLGLAHYQLNRQVFNLVSNELRQHVALLSQDSERQRQALLYDAAQLAAQAVPAGWFILDTEPLPDSVSHHMPPKPILAVVREDGVITRSTLEMEHPLLQELPNWAHFSAALRNHHPQTGWLRLNQVFYAIASQPVSGSSPARGAVFALTPLVWPQMASLKNTGLVIFDQHGKILSTQPLSWDLPQFTAELEAVYRATPTDGENLGLSNDDYAYLLQHSAVLPSFMLLQSVHNQVDFMHVLLWPTLGILLLVVSVWLYMVSILQKQLQQVLDAMMLTVEHIERENYSHRLHLPDREELNRISDTFNEMLESLEERERIHGVMAQMTSYEVASKLLNGTLRSDGELRRCTVLVADIPNFSALTRKLTAPIALQVLNDYLTRMSFCVEANGGWVDKYMGDTIIAMFGLEKHDRDVALSAIQTAQDMLDAMTLFNLEAAAPRGLSMHLHITIATGKLVTGTVGASHHANYSGFGETINYAISLRRHIINDASQILCDARTHKLFLEAAQSATQQLAELRPLRQDNVILGYQVIPNARLHHAVLPEQVSA